MPRHVAKHHAKAAGHGRRVAHKKAARSRKPAPAKKPVTAVQPVAAEPQVVGVLEIEEFEEEPVFAFPLVRENFTIEEEA